MARRKEEPAVEPVETEAGAPVAPAQVEEKVDANIMATKILRAARNADVTDALNGKILQLKRQLAREKARGK